MSFAGQVHRFRDSRDIRESHYSGADGDYRSRHDNGAQPKPCPLLTRESQSRARRILVPPERQRQQIRLRNAINSQDLGQTLRNCGYQANLF